MGMGIKGKPSKSMDEKTKEDEAKQKFMIGVKMKGNGGNQGGKKE
jgi:hypothetical protein